MTIKQLAEDLEQIAPYIVKIKSDRTSKGLVVCNNLKRLAKKSFSRFEEVNDEMGKSNDGKFRISDPLCRYLELAGMND